MNVVDLNLEEKVTLIGLITFMIDADGHQAEAEAIERALLDALTKRWALQ